MGIWESTLLYLFVILLTCFLTYLAERESINHKKFTAVVLAAAAVLVPSILAGVRDDTVGRDVLEYAVRTFEYAMKAKSFAHMRELSIEPFGYVLTAYVTSRFFDNTGYFLFASQLLVVGPILLVAYKNRSEHPMWLTMCSYMFLLYNNSFNVMKQSISAAFVLLCYCYMKEKKFIKAAACFAVGMSFHFSAVIGLGFIMLSYFIKRKNATASKVMLAAMSLFIVVFLQDISNFLVSHSLLPEKYTPNINAVFGSDDHVYLRIVGFNKHVFLDWLFRVSFVAIPLWFMNKVKKEIDENVKIITIIGIVFYSYVLVAFKTIYGGRISLYCDFFLVLLIPSLTKVFGQKTVSERFAANAFLVGYMAIYWFAMVMIFGASASNHFVFRF